MKPPTDLELNQATTALCSASAEIGSALVWAKEALRDNLHPLRTIHGVKAWTAAQRARRELERALEALDRLGPQQSEGGEG